MTDWPTSLPADVLANSFAELWEQENAQQDVQNGEPVSTFRTLIDTQVVRGSVQLTSTQFDILMAFYQTTLSDGILPFNFLHPRKQTTESFQFEGPPPTMRALDYDALEVQFSLRRRP